VGLIDVELARDMRVKTRPGMDNKAES
jgi:hypothetical protein